ncbi:transcriptional adapter 1-like isoform X2 [Colletes gigas]|uniref:transcriptional adapter 1-like isoform X2 n=1 Tax=Colletes gigas TaxID=935657 RepID=UPI001C9A681E|nr:transcriptional adapter 1-like isoform X2 [Colletes gigas]
MTTSKELNLARKSLVASLGENAKVYFEKMKLWFQMKTTKEEFDCEARNIMTEDQVHLHNEFLLCLFNKVRGLAAATPTRKIDRDKAIKEKRLRLKRKYKTDKSNFEPADMYVEVLSQTSSPVGDEPIGANRSSAQELVLPDRTFVLARLMLAAWENNMDGAEENTAHIVIAATQIFLKNILTAIFTRRKGYSVREDCTATEIVDPYGQVPAIKPNFEEAEQATAFAYACSPQTIPPPLKPVNAADLQHTLKMYKNLVSNHTIYATNMERLFTYATHPTWEDFEAKKLICQQTMT